VTTGHVSGFAIDRRRLLGLLAVAVASTPRAVRAQAKVPRVGVVSSGSQSNVEVFLQSLREAGHVPGQSIVVEWRRTEGYPSRYQPGVEELVREKVDVLVVSSIHGINAVRAVKTSTPVVVLDLESDPLATGVIATLARPGGNVTGFFLDGPELSAKQVQLLREAVPRVSRVALLWDLGAARAQFEATERAARGMGIGVVSAPVRKPADFAAAVEAAARDGARALIALSAPMMRIEQRTIDELALRHRLPSVTLFDLLPDGSGFMSYGPSLEDIWRRSAQYVDRILKGARPAEMPIQRPVKFALAVNLRTAKALGLTIPPSVLLRADRVIGE
jgi:putative ABC transport system substrate-binding protein